MSHILTLLIGAVIGSCITLVAMATLIVSKNSNDVQEMCDYKIEENKKFVVTTNKETTKKRDIIDIENKTK